MLLLKLWLFTAFFFICNFSLHVFQFSWSFLLGSIPFRFDNESIFNQLCNSDQQIAREIKQKKRIKRKPAQNNVEMKTCFCSKYNTKSKNQMYEMIRAMHAIQKKITFMLLYSIQHAKSESKMLMWLGNEENGRFFFPRTKNQ